VSVIGYRCDLPIPEPCHPLSLVGWGLGAMRREFDICFADQISPRRISCPMTSWAGKNFVFFSARDLCIPILFALFFWDGPSVSMTTCAGICRRYGSKP